MGTAHDGEDPDRLPEVQESLLESTEEEIEDLASTLDVLQPAQDHLTQHHRHRLSLSLCQRTRGVEIGRP